MEETKTASARLRDEVALSRSGKRTRCSLELRERLLAYARDRWRLGATTQQVAEELGLKKTTLTAWRAESGASPRAGRELSPVRIVVPAARGLVLHVAGGHRVEGLNLGELQVLLEGLV